MSPIAYSPPYAQKHDSASLTEFIRTRTFALFVSSRAEEALIAHAPVVLGDGRMRFHLAKGNPFLLAAHAGARAKAVFQGPDAYISPDWYDSADQVPTWNYVAVYVEGALRVLSRAELIDQVDALTAAQEAHLAPKKPWTRAKMTPGLDERMFSAIVGVELTIERLEGKFKLSQNRTQADINGAAKALDAQGHAALANLMRHKPR